MISVNENFSISLADHHHVTAALAVQQFATHLRRNCRVVVYLDQLQQRILLLLHQIFAVTLHESQQTLVPQHWHWRAVALPVTPGQQVIHHRVHHTVRQRVLFVEEGAHENRRGTLVLASRLGQLHQTRGRVQHWHARLFDDARHDERFAQRTRRVVRVLLARLDPTQWQHNALEPRSRLVRGPTQRFVQVRID